MLETIIMALLPIVVTLLLGLLAGWRHDFSTERKTKQTEKAYENPPGNAVGRIFICAWRTGSFVPAKRNCGLTKLRDL